MVVFHHCDLASYGFLKAFLHLSSKKYWAPIWYHVSLQKLMQTRQVYKKIGQLITLGSYTASTKTPTVSDATQLFYITVIILVVTVMSMS